jgi:ATP-dependent RNA helicase DHX29
LYNLRPEIFDKPKKGKKSRVPTSAADDPQASKLQRKISAIENDVLFDRKEAEYFWKEKLDELRKEAAIFRRADTEKELVEKKEPEPEPDTTPPLEDGDGDLLGDMFQDDEPTLELGVITEELNKASITIRDFGKWTGLSPRRVLEEACKARYALSTLFVAYADLSQRLRV